MIAVLLWLLIAVALLVGLAAWVSLLNDGDAA